MKKFTCRSLFSRSLLLLLAFLLTGRTAIAQTFEHPGIPFSSSDLTQLKANLTQEPWLSAYNAFKADNRSKLTYTPAGPFVTVSRVPDLNLGQWRNDMISIHNLTFMWIFTEDTAYAGKATRLLDAWAVTNVTMGGGEIDLDLGDYVSYFVTGADILKATYSGWTPLITTHVNNWFNTVMWPYARVPNPVKGLNQGALAFKIAFSIAAFLDDPIKWNQTVEQYRTDAGGGLPCSLPNGQVGDAGRDEGHWYGEAVALTWSAEVAWKQRVDLFSELGNRLLATSELYTRFNLDTAGLFSNFIPFGGTYGYYTNWGATGGARRQSDMYNTIQNAYVFRKGLTAPNTLALRNVVGESTYSFLFRKTSDTSTATPPAPIIYPTTEAVANLTNQDIGNTGIAGTASHSSGTWTVSGAGNSIADAVNFTYKQITGNATIVAKINSNTAGTAVSGLMIRQTAATGSNYVSMTIGANGRASLNARGMGFGSIGNHSQPKAPWWLKLERLNGKIYNYHSVDGINWTCMGIYVSTLPDTAYLGLCIISNNTSLLNTATFTNVSITNISPAGSPVITSATSAMATLNTAFTYTVSATNSPATYSAVNLPSGLMIDAATGAISGMPSVTGTFFITIGATNVNGTGTAILMLKIANDVPPAAPTGVTATVVNTSNIRISWPAVANATSYSVKRSSTAGGPYTTIATGITGLNFTDAAPVPEVLNYYVVTALAGTLESGNSNQVSASVPPAIPAKPAITIQSIQLVLNWPAASGAATYNVKRSTVIGGPYTTIATVSATSYTDAAVTPGVGYYYVISSVGSVQESGNSPEAFGVAGATAVTWSATPSSTDWNSAGNWEENTVPASPGIVTFKSTTDSVLTNNLTGLNLARVLFDTTASTYTISGNSLALTGDIVNASPMAQTLAMPLVLSNATTVSNPSGAITLSGNISGSSRLTKNGAGVLYISSNNTYSGGTTINGPTAGFPANSGIGISVSGTGTSGVPTAGALGTGNIIMNGGSLFSEGTGNFFLYNNIEIVAGRMSYFFQSNGGLYLAGKMTGSGTVRNDGNVGNGLHLSGDNSGFSGTFQAFNRSSAHRIRFDNAASGSAAAQWSLDNRFTDGQGFAFGSGTIHFGSLTGSGLIRNDASGTVIISIGALNLNATFAGTISSANTNFIVNVVKLGTGTQIFTGNNTYTGPTTIQQGAFLLNNNATTGSFTSPIVANAGTFGGNGRSQSAVTIGTGTGTGATLEPGNAAIGTFTTSAALTLRADAIYKAEIGFATTTADKVVAGSVSLTNAQLSLTALTNGTLPSGTNFIIIDNTGTTAVSGTFNGLPENTLISVGGYDFRITYVGGTGNDVVLLDNRTIILPVRLLSYTASLQSNTSVLLTWKTATELNNDYYTIERSVDGIQFSSFGGKIQSLGSAGATYNLVDNQPAKGNNYYRLKQTDKDGKLTDLGTRLVKWNEKNSWMIYPNPVKGSTIYIRAGEVTTVGGSVSIGLYDMPGRQVVLKTYNSIAAGSLIELHLEKTLPAGKYFIKINGQEILPVMISR